MDGKQTVEYLMPVELSAKQLSPVGGDTDRPVTRPLVAPVAGSDQAATAS